MRYASVCDGIGAVHCAWQPLGWHCEWTAEIDAFPAAVVEQRWGFPNRGDMTKFTEWNDADKEPNEVAAGELEPSDPVQDHAGAVRQDAGAAGRRVRPLRVRDGEASSRPRPCDGGCSRDTVPPVQCETACGRGRRLDDAGLGVPVGHEKRFADIDVLVGGTPCQAFSVAGLRRSLEDERGNLSLVFVKLMDAIDDERKRLGKPPAICVWENVPGVLSTKDNAFGCFLAGLAGEDIPLQPPGGKWSNAGYVLGPKRAIAWRVLDAQYFGVAQRRRRVFLVASARDGFSPAAVLFESESVRRDNPPSRAKGQGVAAATTSGTGSGGEPIWRAGDQANSEHCIGHAGTLNCDKGQQGGIVASTKSKRAQSTTDDESWVPGEVAPTFNCFDQGDTRATTVVAFVNRTRDGIKVPEVMKDGVAPALLNPGGGGRSDAVNVVVPAAQAFTHSGYSNKPAWITGDRTDCLPSSGHGDTSHQGIGAMTPIGLDFQNCANTGDVSGTLMGEAQKKGGEAGHGVWTPMAVRRLTPRECERLQGFPDDYTAIEYRKKPAADGPRYRALGNSMAVPVMRWIGEKLSRVDSF